MNDINENNEMNEKNEKIVFNFDELIDIELEKERIYKESYEEYKNIQEQKKFLIRKIASRLGLKYMDFDELDYKINYLKEKGYKDKEINEYFKDELLLKSLVKDRSLAELKNDYEVISHYYRPIPKYRHSIFTSEGLINRTQAFTIFSLLSILLMVVLYYFIKLIF